MRRGRSDVARCTLDDRPFSAQTSLVEMPRVGNIDLRILRNAAETFPPEPSLAIMAKGSLHALEQSPKSKSSYCPTSD